MRQLKQEEKEKELPSDTLPDIETKLLSRLNWVFLNMTRAHHGLCQAEIQNKDFFLKGREIANSIKGFKDRFFSSLEVFYDRTR